MGRAEAKASALAEALAEALTRASLTSKDALLSLFLSLIKLSLV